MRRPRLVNIPKSATLHAARATKTVARGIAIRNGASTDCERRTVQTVYMPRGNTAPQ
jgi:hypothetical protein